MQEENSNQPKPESEVAAPVVVEVEAPSSIAQEPRMALQEVPSNAHDIGPEEVASIPTQNADTAPAAAASASASGGAATAEAKANKIAELKAKTERVAAQAQAQEKARASETAAAAVAVEEKAEVDLTAATCHVRIDNFVRPLVNKVRLPSFSLATHLPSSGLNETLGAIAVAAGQADQGRFFCCSYLGGLVG